MYFNENVVIKEKISAGEFIQTTENGEIVNISDPSGRYSGETVKSTKTTIPFFKNNEADYSKILTFLGEGYEQWAFLIFIPL